MYVMYKVCTNTGLTLLRKEKGEEEEEEEEEEKGSIAMKFVSSLSLFPFPFQKAQTTRKARSDLCDLHDF